MTNTMPLYKRLAQLGEALSNCEKTGNADWARRHFLNIDGLCARYLPSGNGFYTGTAFVGYDERKQRMILSTNYHVMDDNGYYRGWMSFDIVVRPDLAFDIRIHLRNIRYGGDIPRHLRASTKEYVVDTFYQALRQEV